MISLEIKEVIGKIAYSKDGKKIGEIRDAKETMEKILKHSKKYLLFQHNRFFKRPFKVAIELTDDAVIDGEKVILSITIQEYKKEVLKVQTARRQQAAQAKLQEASNNQKAASLSMPFGKL
jgi:hypothetical protein